MSVYDKMYQKRGFSNTQLLILSKVNSNSTVLELGPATGYMTRVLREEKDCTIDAVELDKVAGQSAAPYCRRLLYGSIEDTELIQQLVGPFDYIIAADVLEHLRNPEKTLHLLHPLLNQEGRLIISLPNIAYWKIRLQLLSGHFDYTDSGIMDRTHYRFFTRDTAAKMIESAGFKVLEILSAEPDRPGFGGLKSGIKRKFSTLFSGNFVFIAKQD